MPKSILIVEDSEINLKLASRILEGEGYCVFQMRDAEGALELIRKTPLDLILLDIQLPEMDGLTLARLIKSEPSTHKIPILALSAHAMRDEIDQAFAAGVDGYISKPINTRKFPQQIADCLNLGANPNSSSFPL